MSIKYHDASVVLYSLLQHRTADSQADGSKLTPMPAREMSALMTPRMVSPATGLGVGTGVGVGVGEAEGISMRPSAAAEARLSSTLSMMLTTACRGRRDGHGDERQARWARG